RAAAALETHARRRRELPRRRARPAVRQAILLAEDEATLREVDERDLRRLPRPDQDARLDERADASAGAEEARRGDEEGGLHPALARLFDLHRRALVLPRQCAPGQHLA